MRHRKRDECAGTERGNQYCLCDSVEDDQQGKHHGTGKSTLCRVAFQVFIAKVSAKIQCYLYSP